MLLHNIFFRVSPSGCLNSLGRLTPYAEQTQKKYCAHKISCVLSIRNGCQLMCKPIPYVMSIVRKKIL